jgi:hypothetical protein
LSRNQLIHQKKIRNKKKIQINSSRLKIKDKEIMKIIRMKIVKRIILVNFLVGSINNSIKNKSAIMKIFKVTFNWSSKEVNYSLLNLRLKKNLV